MGGLYTLPGGHSAPFRQMIAHPTVVQRLNMMLGPGYFEAFEPMACNYIPGTCGGSLHAGPVLEGSTQAIWRLLWICSCWL